MMGALSFGVGWGVERSWVDALRAQAAVDYGRRFGRATWATVGSDADG
jgi:hypothetical protein